MANGFLHLAAGAVVLLHVAFVIFVVVGGLLAIRWPRVIWIHIPAAFWGVLIEVAGWVCPLTPLENYLREQGGAAGYQGDFIAHYIVPVLYPAGLTRDRQLVLGGFAFAVNAVVYGDVVLLRRRRGVKV
jgi:hypothetical protein